MNANDRLLSIRHYLWTIYESRFTTDHMRIETEGRIDNLTRPTWSIRRTNYRDQSLGKAGYIDIDQWHLSYFSMGRQDTDNTLQALHNALEFGGMNKNWIGRIPGWRFNWQYPQPVVTQYQDLLGTLTLGTYQIRVSGIDLCNNESAASAPLLVTTTAPHNALKIRILRQPVLGTLFKSYNVYINGHLETNVPHPLTDIPWYPTATIYNVTGTGIAPKEPATVLPIRWKFIRVDSYSETVREDDITNGVFNAFVTLQTSTYQERDMVQSDVMQQITGKQTVLSESQVTTEVPVGGYVVLPTNPVRIGY